jgi:hypothetical protein
LKVSVRFSCTEVLGRLESGDYELHAGGTVRELLSTCETKYAVAINEEYLKWLLVVVNGHRVNWDAVVPEGGRVLFLRGPSGG